MNVKKAVSAPRKGQTCLPQTLAHVIFFHIFFTQASTPSLRGPAIGFKHHDREAIVLTFKTFFFFVNKISFFFFFENKKRDS